MTKKLLLSLLICFLGNLSWSQTRSIRIEGVTQTDDFSAIKDVEVILSIGFDTIQRIYSDEDGKFSVVVELEIGSEVKLTTHYKNYQSRETRFKIENEFTTDFFFELELMSLPVNHGGLYAIYELNETEEFTQFQVHLLINVIKENPSVCIEFIHVRNPKESLSLAQERIRNFQEYLELNAVPMNHLIFNKTDSPLNCEGIEKCQSRIDARILSLDQTCHP